MTSEPTPFGPEYRSETLDAIDGGRFDVIVIVVGGGDGAAVVGPAAMGVSVGVRAGSGQHTRQG